MSPDVHPQKSRGVPVDAIGHSRSLPETANSAGLSVLWGAQLCDLGDFERVLLRVGVVLVRELNSGRPQQHRRPGQDQHRPR